jgi:hypothetical protein
VESDRKFATGPESAAASPGRPHAVAPHAIYLSHKDVSFLSFFLERIVTYQALVGTRNVPARAVKKLYDGIPVHQMVRTCVVGIRTGFRGSTESCATRTATRWKRQSHATPAAAFFEFEHHVAAKLVPVHVPVTARVNFHEQQRQLRLGGHLMPLCNGDLIIIES